MDATLEAIAAKYLDLGTLNIRNSDELDFHEHFVASIRTALEAAYNAGKASK